ncbi:uncharacterized protein BX664DRAFT_356098 [Halteromyces radiatus]|uniref:uncharacterized protein n=1 Tax=Halteromyces radiatus TaxID=101107 RepID=UPI002220CAA4|nr:uncharacterized protein BX664DRAFT_356098 [Halteromyces radiatus]KAI8096778.1 hypothetical protein BX664DRAFT_356098 [Halteromyces radiatus]
MNNNTFEVLAEGSEEGERTEIETFKFTGLVADAKVSIQEESFNKNEYPSHVSLLACSGKYGYFVVGHIKGFSFGQTSALRAVVYRTEKGSTTKLDDKIIISLNQPVHHIRLSSDEHFILVGLADGSLLSYRVTDLMEQKENAKPAHSISVNTPIIDLRPNTEAYPELACVLLKGHQSRIINWKTGEIVAQLPESDFSAISWSPKGKQIVCGRLNGTLEHYDTSGVKKDSLPPPESMQAGYGDEQVNRNVQAVLWIENHQFLVIYSRPPEPESDEFINDGYVVDRKPKVGTGPKYTHLAEVTPIFSPEGRNNHFYMEMIRNFGTKFLHIIILANGATNEVSVVGEDAEGNWSTWDLPENGMASLPLSEETNFDTFPLGLALDFTASEKLPPYDPSESDVGVEPVPVLFHLNDEGHIGSFHCYSEEFASSGQKYQGMQTPTTLSSTSEPITTITTTTTTTASTTSIPTTTTTTTTPKPAFDANKVGTTTSSSLLSSSAFSSGPFGAALQSGSSGTSFASLTKVQGATTPSFGNLQGFGSLAKNTVSNAVTPSFGSTTSFGSMGQGSTTTPSFGSTTSFGSSATATPAFGSTTGFGALAKKESTTSATPAFGSTTGFGALAQKDTSVTTSTPAFGTTTGFGALAKNEGMTSSTMPFGQTGFGSTSTGFGAFGQKDTISTSATTTPTSGSSSSFEIVNKTDTTADELSLEKGNDDNKAVSKAEEVESKDQQVDQDERPKIGEEIKTTTITTTETTKGEIEEEKTTDKTTTTDSSNVTPFTTVAKSTGSSAQPQSTFGSFGTAVKPTTGDAAKSFSFGSLAKNTVPGAVTPSFGTNTGFGALAKNTVPGAVAPSFGTSSGFGALAKNTVPGAVTPTFGSSSFGTPAPKASMFGTSTSTTASSVGFSVPATTTTTTKTITTPTAATPITTPLPDKKVSSPLTAEKVEPKSIVKEEEKEEKAEELAEKEPSPKSEAKEGMAKEFEALFFKISAELEKLSSLQVEFGKQLQQHDQQLNSMTNKVQDLTDCVQQWRSNGCNELGTVAVTVTEKLKDCNIKEQEEQIAKLELKTMELMSKKGQVKHCLETEEDANLITLLKERELDESTRDECERLENRCASNGKLLDELEYRIVDKKNKQKKLASEDTRNFSFYDFHCAIQDVERDLRKKDSEVKALEQRLSVLRFQENQRKAEQSPSRITFEDLTDDDDDDEEVREGNQGSGESTNVTRGQFSGAHIDYTVKYIQGEQFLNKLYDVTSKRSPLSVTVDISGNEFKQ